MCSWTVTILYGVPVLLFVVQNNMGRILQELPILAFFLVLPFCAPQAAFQPHKSHKMCTCVKTPNDPDIISIKLLLIFDSQ